VLGRAERPLALAEPLAALRSERVVVTGADGGLGRSLVRLLRSAGIAVRATDLDTLDVTSPQRSAAFADATLIFHLAAEKDACDGEAQPERALHVNAVGTANVLAPGIRTVLASTCKAASPETVYGASKLIAERLTLNAGGSVSRLFNVVDSPRNVFETWAALAPDEPIPVTDCTRRFISSREAVSLLVWTAALEPGRYVLTDAIPRTMREVAEELYPHRPIRAIPRRRGDRMDEPFCAPYETAREVVAGIAGIASLHDAVAPRSP
jgi:nucleoside-diphosphate-sugar epimerase